MKSRVKRDTGLFLLSSGVRVLVFAAFPQLTNTEVGSKGGGEPEAFEEGQVHK